jgi:hypothetical protein
LLHTWSLAVEEQYYMFFPVLMLLGWRLGKPLLAAGLLAIGLASLGLSQWASGHHPSANFYLLPTRLWELLLGSLTAFYLLKKGVEQTATKTAEALGLLGLVLILTAVFRFDSSTPFPGLYALVPTIGTALILLFAKPGMLVTRLLGYKPMVGIGLLSYSAYLWHQPLFAYARLRSPHEPDAALMIALALAVLPLALLSWRYIETPFRDKKRFSRRAIFIMAVALSSVLLGIGLVGHFNHGFGQRTTADGTSLAELDLDARLVFNTGLGESCDKPAIRPASCQTGDNAEILLWGDSHVMHLVDGVLAANPNAQVIQMARSNCGPILELAPTNNFFTDAWAQRCIDFNREVAQWISQPSTPRTVVMSSAFYQNLGEGWMLYTTEHGTRAIDTQLLYQRFEATLRFLVNNGVRPVVFSPLPNNGANIGHCLGRAALHGGGLEQCDIKLAQRTEATLQARKLLQRIDENYEVVWLDDYTCNAGVCRVQEDGVFLYRDHGHLSREGSMHLGKEMDFYRLITQGETDD